MKLLKVSSAVVGAELNRSNCYVKKQDDNVFVKQNLDYGSHFYGQDLVNFRGLSKISLTPFEMRSVNDKKYIQSLAQSLNCSYDKLSSVMGLDELKSILKTSTIANFTPSSPEYMINLHNHTLNSDGKATVKEILDEAEMRGKKSGNNFLISITDHDTIKTAEEALRLIANSPEDYKHIRFVPGVEPCFYYENKDILEKPIPFDAIIYCINPFEKEIKNFFETTSSKNKEFAKNIINSVNEKWNLGVTFEQALKYHPLIKTGGSSGFLKYTKKYIESCLKEQNIQYTDKELLDIFEPYYLNQNGRVTKATANIKDVLKLFANYPQSEVGIAHPCIVEINPKQDADLDFTSKINIKDNYSYKEALLDFVNNCGLKMIELNYQYPVKTVDKYPQIKSLYEFLDKNSGDEYLRTGGTDSHGNTLGKILESR